jgi:uncharacterized protein YraI
MSPKRFTPLLLFILIALLSLTPMVVHGQGGTLAYGNAATGEISATAPLAFYTFSGNANDRVVGEVTGITPGLSPAISLNNPAQQQIANSGGDSSSSGGSPNARVEVLLPANGVYTILVSSLGSTPGQFLIRLNGQQVPASFPLTNAPATVGINGQTSAQSFTFIADPGASSAITLEGDVPFGASVVNGNGTLVASLSQTTLPQVSFAVPAGSDTYTVFVYGVGDAQGTISGQLGAPGQSGAPPAPATTEEPSSSTSNQQPVDPNVCTVVPSGAGTNVRSGPGTDYNVVGQLSSSTVTGYYGDWYAINYNGTTAWVYSGVVTASGPCNNLPFVDAPPAPQNQPPPPQTTEEAAPQNQNTGSESPPPQNQPTAVPPQQTVQTAPPDNDYRFDVDRDNGGTFSQVVSYPDGDTQDKIDVYVNLAQLSPNNARNVNITISCSGPGSEYLAFTRSSRNAQRYTCGQTISYRYSHPYGTQSYYVFLNGGSGAYVNYTLTATTSQ